MASSCSNQCQYCYIFESPLLQGALGLNAFTPPRTYQVSYMFPHLALVSLVLSKFLAECVSGHFRLLILVAPYWMEIPWLPTVLNTLVNVPHQCPDHKRLHHGCFSWLGSQWSAVSAFNVSAA